MADDYLEQLAAEIDMENTYRSRITSGDGSESAGLREAEQLGRETMRLAAMDAATGAQRHSPKTVTLTQLEYNEVVCAIADEIKKYTDKDLADYRDMALAALAPAIPRPPTQGPSEIPDPWDQEHTVDAQTPSASPGERAGK